MTTRKSKSETSARIEQLRREVWGASRRQDADSGRASKQKPRRAGRLVVTPDQHQAGETHDQPDGTAFARKRVGDVFVVGRERPESAWNDTPPERPPAGDEFGKRQVDVGSEAKVKRVLAELVRHRREKVGRVLGIAGLPMHGKTTLAQRLRERAAERLPTAPRYEKTERGLAPWYEIPQRRYTHILIDMAGEDYQALGDYNQELPELMRRFLWPALQHADGLFLLLALPMVWSGWSDDTGQPRKPPAEEMKEMKAAQDRMLRAHMMLLKYAIVASNVDRINRRLGKGKPKFARDRAPYRKDVEDGFKKVRHYRRPVSLLLTKADLYTAGNRNGLYGPPVSGQPNGTSQAIRPGHHDPLVEASRHFPGFSDFLAGHVRFFKWSFCQVLEDRGPSPDPSQANREESDTSSLIGAEEALDFLTRHPWRVPVPGLSTANAVRLDQWRDRQRSEELRRWAGVSRRKRARGTV